MLGYLCFICAIAMIGAYFSACRIVLFRWWYRDEFTEEYALAEWSKHEYKGETGAKCAKEAAIRWSKNWAQNINIKSRKDALRELEYWLNYYESYDF